VKDVGTYPHDISPSIYLSDILGTEVSMAALAGFLEKQSNPTSNFPTQIPVGCRSGSQLG